MMGVHPVHRGLQVARLGNSRVNVRSAGIGQPYRMPTLKNSGNLRFPLGSLVGFILIHLPVNVSSLLCNSHNRNSILHQKIQNNVSTHPLIITRSSIIMAPTTDVDTDLKYLLLVIKNADFKPNYQALATEAGVNNANNASVLQIQLTSDH